VTDASIPLGKCGVEYGDGDTKIEMTLNWMIDERASNWKRGVERTAGSTVRFTVEGELGVADFLVDYF